MSLVNGGGGKHSPLKSTRYMTAISSLGSPEAGMRIYIIIMTSFPMFCKTMTLHLQTPLAYAINTS